MLHFWMRKGRLWIRVSLVLPAPHSYTGEDTLELQGHGGTAILQLVLQSCLEIGARLAQPGEFTQRAFLNEKLDLAQAESVADLIAATTSQAARSAMRSLQGEFSQAIHRQVDGLVLLRMLVEAMLDFPKRDRHSTSHATRYSTSRITCRIRKYFRVWRNREACCARRAYCAGRRANLEKAKLLNRLSGEDVALVSELPGTTVISFASLFKSTV